MTLRTDPWTTVTPCWIDLTTSDVAAAKEFYPAVLGWSFADTGAEHGGCATARAVTAVGGTRGRMLRPGT